MTNISVKTLALPTIKLKSVSMYQADQIPLTKTQNKNSWHQKPSFIDTISEQNLTKLSLNHNNTSKNESRLGSNYKPKIKSIFYERRIRNFEVKLNNRLHIFYGLLYVQFEGLIHQGL